MVKTSNKIAFTLAEVLLALAIIGVIAALTIPTILNNIKNAELVENLKKHYSSLNQLQKKLQADSMNFSDIFVYGETSAQSVDRLSKYLNIAKNCGYEEGCWDEKVKYRQQVNNGSGAMIGSEAVLGAKAILSDGSRISVHNKSQGGELWNNDLGKL